MSACSPTRCNSQRVLRLFHGSRVYVVGCVLGGGGSGGAVSALWHEPASTSSAVQLVESQLAPQQQQRQQQGMYACCGVDGICQGGLLRTSAVFACKQAWGRAGRGRVGKVGGRAYDAYRLVCSALKSALGGAQPSCTSGAGALQSCVCVAVRICRVVLCMSAVLCLPLSAHLERVYLFFLLFQCLVLHLPSMLIYHPACLCNQPFRLASC